jgi:hypothetical protein
MYIKSKTIVARLFGNEALEISSETRRGEGERGRGGEGEKGRGGEGEQGRGGAGGAGEKEFL